MGIKNLPMINSADPAAAAMDLAVATGRAGQELGQAIDAGIGLGKEAVSTGTKLYGELSGSDYKSDLVKKRIEEEKKHNELSNKTIAPEERNKVVQEERNKNRVALRNKYFYDTKALEEIDKHYQQQTNAGLERESAEHGATDIIKYRDTLQQSIYNTAVSAFESKKKGESFDKQSSSYERAIKDADVLTKGMSDNAYLNLQQKDSINTKDKVNHQKKLLEQWTYDVAYHDPNRGIKYLNNPNHFKGLDESSRKQAVSFLNHERIQKEKTSASQIPDNLLLQSIDSPENHKHMEKMDSTQQRQYITAHSKARENFSQNPTAYMPMLANLPMDQRLSSASKATNIPQQYFQNIMSSQEVSAVRNISAAPKITPTQYDSLMSFSNTLSKSDPLTISKVSDQISSAITGGNEQNNNIINTIVGNAVGGSRIVQQSLASKPSTDEKAEGKVITSNIQFASENPDVDALQMLSASQSDALANGKQPIDLSKQYKTTTSGDTKTIKYNDVKVNSIPKVDIKELGFPEITNPYTVNYINSDGSGYSLVYKNKTDYDALKYINGYVAKVPISISPSGDIVYDYRNTSNVPKREVEKTKRPVTQQPVQTKKKTLSLD